MKSAGWSSFFLCVVMLVVSSGIGCGGASSAATVSPVVSPNGSSTVSGQFTASPLSLNFGSVTVDGGASKNVVLTNSSNATVTITSVSTSGPGFSLSGLSLPLDIAAGKAVSFSVSFTPSNSGQASGSVQLSNTASPIAIALNGNGTTAAQHSVTANWIASVSPVAGYNVYRSTQSGGPFMKVNSTIVQDTGYTDTSVTSGSTYFYAVTAVDANSQESNFSNEAKATVPTP